MTAPKLLAVVVALLIAGCASSPEKLAKRSTADLQLYRSQIVARLNDRGGPVMLDPNYAAGANAARGNMFREKEAVERELLRRYEAGDTAAWISLFGARK